MTPTPKPAPCPRRPLTRSRYTLVDLLLAEAGERPETCDICPHEHWPREIERRVQEAIQRG